MQHLEIMLRLVRINVATMGTVARTVYIAGVITDHWGFFYVMRLLSGGVAAESMGEHTFALMRTTSL